MTRKTALTITILVLSIMVFNLYTPSASALMLHTDMPSVFIDPDIIDVVPGENITIAVKIFNLTDNIYMSNETWELGEDLPPPGVQYNHSLGNLYGFDIQISWDTTLLNYTSHQVLVPVETYSEGVLHTPQLQLKDEINTTAGTGWFAYSSMAPANPFNAPDLNATILTMDFTVLANSPHGVFNITDSKLAVWPDVDALQKVPHHLIPADIIPEFPSLMILPLFMITALLVAILLKRKTLHL